MNRRSFFAALAALPALPSVLTAQRPKRDRAIAPGVFVLTREGRIVASGPVWAVTVDGKPIVELPASIGRLCPGDALQAIPDVRDPWHWTTWIVPRPNPELVFLFD